MADSRRAFQLQGWPIRSLCLHVFTVIVPMVTGCGESPDTLTVVERITLTDSSYVTLLIRPTGEIWLGRPGAAARIDSAGREDVVLPVYPPSVPLWIGAVEDKLYYYASPALGAIDAAAPGLLTERQDLVADAYAFDPLNRFLYRMSDAGSVTAHDPSTLEAVWGWAAVGVAATAAVLSPEGDRFYEALGEVAGGESAELLIRDLQTGRILGQIELEGSVHVLFAGLGHSLYGVHGPTGMGAGGVFALRWREGTLREDWRRSLDDLDLSPPVHAALSPSGRLLAVLGTGNEAGLHILDVETGRTVERLRHSARDVAFDPDDGIYLLAAGELLRLE